MLTDGQIERFSRQIILREVGVRGQQRLLASRALFVGLTAAASTALAYLAAAGVGEIGLADDGLVSGPDAPLAYCETDLGHPRSGLATRLVTTLHPDASALVFTDPASALASRPWDVAIFCGSRAATACNLASIEARVPGIVLNADTRRAWVAGIAGHRADVPCWSCAEWAPWPESEVRDATNPTALPVLTGVVGAVVAIEAVKILLDIGVPILGRLLTWGPDAPGPHVTNLDKNRRCTTCACRGPSFAAPV